MIFLPYFVHTTSALHQRCRLVKGLGVGIKKRVNANCATSFIPIKFHFVIIFDKLSPYLDNESILLKTIWTVSKIILMD